jgi:predicted ATP-grasp superfamily ATP-dependent carboligase
MLNEIALDRTVPVVVFKVGGNRMHHGILGIIRSLGRLEVPVYTAVDTGGPPASTSRYLAGSFFRETRDADSSALLNHLAEIGEKLGRRAILLPTNDFTAAFVAEHSGELEKWFIFPRVPRELPRQLSNKKYLSLLCRHLRMPCPKAVFPNSEQDVQSFIDNAIFPVVVKAAESHRLPMNVPSTAIAQNPDQLLTMYRQAACPQSPNLLFQEYIPQSCSEDWIFHGYCNLQTNCFIAFTGRKLRSYPPFAGITTLGIAIWNESLSRQATQLLKAITYCGIVDLDFRFDRRDGQYKLLDFNPRIGANFRMFENQAGVDVARALHLDLTGRRVPLSPLVEGRKFIVEPHDLLASIEYNRRGSLAVRAWWRSIRGSRELAWFYWRDPVPFLVMCSHVALAVIRHAIKGSWVRIRNSIPVSRRKQSPSLQSMEQRPVRGRHWGARKSQADPGR